MVEKIKEVVGLGKYEHKHYTHCEEKDADAVGWAFVSKQKFERFPFKFEPLGDDEIRANITYTGLCASDYHAGRSEWGLANYPLVPGHEIVGIVSKVGKNVKDFRVGERVAYGPFRAICESCTACKEGPEVACLGMDFLVDKGIYGEYWGGWATAFQQPAKFAFKIPESLPSDKISPLLCAGITVYSPLAKYAKAGTTVAIIGIGGLGHLAVQYANKMGCKVTAFTSTPSKEEEIRKLGAHEVVDATNKSILEKHASKYNVVLNVLPVAKDDLWGQYVEMTGPAGTFVQVGLPPTKDKFTLNPMDIVKKNVTIAGSLVGSRKEMKDMLDFSAKYNVLPIVEFYDFEEFPKGLDVLEHGKAHYRGVVNVEKWSKENNFFKMD